MSNKLRASRRALGITDTKTGNKVLKQKSLGWSEIPQAIRNNLNAMQYEAVKQVRRSSPGADIQYHPEFSAQLISIGQKVFDAGGIEALEALFDLTVKGNLYYDKILRELWGELLTTAPITLFDAAKINASQLTGEAGKTVDHDQEMEANACNEK